MAKAPLHDRCDVQTREPAFARDRLAPAQVAAVQADAVVPAPALVQASERPAVDHGRVRFALRAQVGDLDARAEWQRAVGDADVVGVNLAHQVWGGAAGPAIAGVREHGRNAGLGVRARCWRADHVGGDEQGDHSGSSDL